MPTRYDHCRVAATVPAPRRDAAVTPQVVVIGAGAAGLMAAIAAREAGAPV